MAREKTDYTSVKIPNGLASKIDELIDWSEGDFTNRTDVIKFAIRKYYEDNKR